MPNYCRNEINFWVSDWEIASIPEPVRIQQILDCIRETNERYQARVQNMRALDRKHKTHRYYDSKSQLTPDVLDFNSLIPYPEHYRQMDEDFESMTREEYGKKYPEAFTDFIGKKREYPVDGYNAFGYQWCTANWGTKWNAIGSIYVPLHKTVYFDTAWAPPFKIVSELHKRFPDVMMNFEYYERGMAMIGGCEFIPEHMFDPSDYIAAQVPDIERALKEGKEPPPSVWAPGVPYNLWTADYMGYKGG